MNNKNIVIVRKLCLQISPLVSSDFLKLKHNIHRILKLNNTTSTNGTIFLFKYMHSNFIQS